MLRKHLLISMASSSDMEISLHLVDLQTAEKSTAITTRLPPLQLRRLRKLRSSASSMSNNIMHMLLSKPLLMIMEPLARNNPPLRIFPKPMHTPSINPLPPIRRVLFQHIAREDPIPSSILHIDVDIVALHRNDDVKVDLQVMAYAFFYREGVGFVASPPACEFGEDEKEGDAEHGDGPFSAAGGLRYILGFCLGYEGVSSCHSIQL
jgi:hypothetical protein